MSKSVTQLHNVSPEEFKNEILSGVEKSLKNFSQNFQPKEPTTWVTRKQLREMLSVSYVTIHDWCNKGILKPYKIGRQVRFKLIDIEEVLSNSRNDK